MTKTMISARIPEKLGSKIEALARSSRRSKAFVVTEALEDYVKREAWHRKRIDEAVKQADESGEFISNEKMIAWLKSWGTNNKLPPPKPDIFKKKRR